MSHTYNNWCITWKHAGGLKRWFAFCEQNNKSTEEALSKLLPHTPSPRDALQTCSFTPTQISHRLAWSHKHPCSLCHRSTSLSSDPNTNTFIFWFVNQHFNFNRKLQFKQMLTMGTNTSHLGKTSFMWQNLFRSCRFKWMLLSSQASCLRLFVVLAYTSSTQQVKEIEPFPIIMNKDPLHLKCEQAHKVSLAHASRGTKMPILR